MVITPVLMGELIEKRRPMTILEPQDTDPRETEEQNRIVLVSPFPAFNIAFETFLKATRRKYDLDEISEAKIPLFPYIDVPKREQDRGMPAFIVDLRRIARHSKEGPTIHEFMSYFNWACETVDEHASLRTRYLAPLAGNPLYAAISVFPLDQYFQPTDFKMNGLSSMLKSDIERMVANSSEGNFELFGEARLRD